MNRKVFISFLGIGDYSPVRYYLEADVPNCNITTERFIQVSLLKMLESSFTDNDMVYIFLTKLAKIKNWDDREDSTPGLCSQLKFLQAKNILKSQFDAVYDLPEGYTSEQIWDIFDLILSKLQINDEVYLDITHAFRHIPMLALALINYAKTLKSITVKAIYYGAFEKILNDHGISGSKFETLPVEKRVAPVLNLLSLEQLQQWSFAAQNFNKYGNSSFISDLTKNELKPILNKTKGKHEGAKKMQKFSYSLSEVTNNIATCRGKKIEEQETLLSTLHLVMDLKESGTFIKPFEVLLGNIEDKLRKLSAESAPSWFNAAKWCLEHKLIQQGITLLLEGIISHVIKKINKPDTLNSSEKDVRDIVSQALHIGSRKLAFENWNVVAKKNKATIKEVLELEDLSELFPIYSAISNKRNDINHAGYLNNDNLTYKDFEQALEQCIQKLENFKFLS